MAEPTLPPENLDAHAAPEAQDEELRLGSTDRGKAANGVVIALSRAARSFLLYDPSNEAIRHFLDALRRAAESFLQAYGDLALEVRPWDLVANGEIVYHDVDRERSIAFRLFRDGVRRVTLDAGLSWDELLKLLEVLSIRYTGVRQTEDDMVVLLWKAGFQNIHIEAVEGFVADEEDEGGASQALRAQARHFGIEAAAPPDFDLPLPRPAGVVPVRHQAVPDTALRELLAEDDNPALPRLCVKLVAELCRVVLDPTEHFRFEDILPQLHEVRDFLLAEGLLSAVNHVVQGLGRIRFRDAADERARIAYLASFGDAHALAKLIAGASKTTQVAPVELVHLLGAVEGNHAQTIIHLLGTTRSEASRRVGRSLLEHYAGSAQSLLVDAIPTVEPLVAVELLQVLRKVDPIAAVKAAEGAATSGAIEVQLEAIRCIEAAPVAEGAGALIARLIASDHEDVRIASLELVAHLRVPGAYSPLLDRVKRMAPLGFPPREAEAMGVALYHANPERAVVQFAEWCKPKGFFKQVLPAHPWLQFVAVSGLAWAPGDEPETLIRFVSERAGADVQKQCTDVMIKRRRRARGLR